MFRKLGMELHQSWVVVFLCVGIVFGMILGLVFRINYFSSPYWIICVSLLMTFAFLKPKFAFMIIALVAGMILAFFRVSEELKTEDYIRQFFGQTVMVSGVIDGDPETDEGGTKFKLKADASLYVSSYKNEKLARGDLVELSGKLSEGFGIYAGYMYRPKIVSWSRPEPGDLVLKVRNWFSERIKGLIHESEVSLGLSYLLGMRAGLSDELNERLRTVGLVHIVVASGAHLSILVEIARKVFGKLSRFAGLLFSILFIVFFMAMVGWTPSILRAGIMAILNLVVWYVGRKFAAWRIILIVAAFTLILNPNFLINLGWLLSFASYGGIMILGPRLTRFFYGEKKPGFISSIILTTVAATLMTLPITLYYYGQISLISVFANLLILPTLPYAMGLVFLTGVFAGVPGIEIVISFLATKLLDFHIFIVNFFGEQKQFLIETGQYHLWAFSLYLIIIVWLSIGHFKRKMIK
ncbi:ComEC/Rec2 family competence protein [Candidatus Saccharibacteria bacterium]|nr:ComEC/Rec2 family competence protein [Candidatus Saccharibacteria bacterium]MBR3253467.1 ComEC/Rec2 family competence protein [Candidatus Saccharibacteria bacterium]